jgi:hypothetical protein
MINDQFPWSPASSKADFEYSERDSKSLIFPTEIVLWSGRLPNSVTISTGHPGWQSVIFETEDDSQVIAKYLDAKLNLDLFPAHGRLQRIVWRYIENEVRRPV